MQVSQRISMINRSGLCRCEDNGGVSVRGNEGGSWGNRIHRLLNVSYDARDGAKGRNEFVIGIANDETLVGKRMPSPLPAVNDEPPSPRPLDECHRLVKEKARL